MISVKYQSSLTPLRLGESGLGLDRLLEDHNARLERRWQLVARRWPSDLRSSTPSFGHVVLRGTGLGPPGREFLPTDTLGEISIESDPIGFLFVLERRERPRLIATARTIN